jgi:tRNA threonylcarbamoyl adenosine modification protein YeaZ
MTASRNNPASADARKGRGSDPRILALDTASPVVSVALYGKGGDGGGVEAERSVEISRSSRRLLEMVDEVLEETGLAISDVTGFVALRGPGSFTGLRVGLATVMGFHQALGTPTTALSTLEVMAAAGSRMGEPEDGREGRKIPGGRIVAAVDVLRGEWAAQPFRPGWPPRPEAAADRIPVETLGRFLPCALVGFGLDKLREQPELGDREELVLLDPPPLAPIAARLAAEHPPAWDAALLTEPLYFRPPPVTLPTRRPGTPRSKSS